MVFRSTFAFVPKDVFNTPLRMLKSQCGFTLIELMIVVAIIAIIMTLALPVYTNYAIRAKIGESLSVAAAVKTSVAATCVKNPVLTDLNTSKVGYSFVASKWIETITVTGDCAQPVISILTKGTGVSAPTPAIELTGFVDISAGAITWVCSSSNTPNHLLPATCRS